jgi:hypothetical protein
VGNNSYFLIEEDRKKSKLQKNQTNKPFMFLRFIFLSNEDLSTIVQFRWSIENNIPNIIRLKKRSQKRCEEGLSKEPQFGKRGYHDSKTGISWP